MLIKQIQIQAYVLAKLHWKHRVSEDEVREVLSSRHRLFMIERGLVQGENVYLALGQTAAGRYLSVFFIYKRNQSALIISARDMADKERRRYESR